MEHINPQYIETFIRLIGNSKRPVVVTHARPDGDAIGSSTAMLHFLLASGKSNAEIILNDNPPRFLEFLTEGIKDRMMTYDDDPEKVAAEIRDSDLIICLDFNAFYRTSRLEDLLAASKAPKILIDHHLNPDKEKFDVAFSETEVSSASELLYHVLMATPQIDGDAWALGKDASLALMTGMTTDTNNFNNSVHPSTLGMASALLSTGTDRDLILQKINLEHSENRLRLKGHILKDLLKVTEDGVAYIVLDKKTQEEYNMQEGDTEGFVNEPLSIAKVRMSIFAREDKNEIRISIRSKKGTSANTCAKMFFNGGGHENAAGGKLHMPVEEAAGYIRDASHTYMTEYENN